MDPRRVGGTRSRRESSTFTWLLEPMIVQSGFEIRDVTYSDDGFFAQYLLVVT